MFNMTKIAVLVGIFTFAISNYAGATYYPNDGDLYYDGAYYMDSYFRWNSPGPWNTSNPGYEHDLWVHEPSFFTSTCTTWSNMPDFYDDCPTAGVLDPNGPVFSFGTYSADELLANVFYFGAWGWTSHATPLLTSGFNLQGQENRNACFGIPTPWCMFSERTQNLITGWQLFFGGVPTVIFF